MVCRQKVSPPLRSVDHCARAKTHGAKPHVNGVNGHDSCRLVVPGAALHAGRARRHVIARDLHAVYVELRSLHASSKVGRLSAKGTNRPASVRPDQNKTRPSEGKSSHSERWGGRGGGGYGKTYCQCTCVSGPGLISGSPLICRASLQAHSDRLSRGDTQTLLTCACCGGVGPSAEMALGWPAGPIPSPGPGADMAACSRLRLLCRRRRACARVSVKPCMMAARRRRGIRCRSCWMYCRRTLSPAGRTPHDKVHKAVIHSPVGSAAANWIAQQLHGDGLAAPLLFSEAPRTAANVMQPSRL